MKYVLICCLTAAVLSLSACSYVTDFVLINRSDNVLQVQYRVKDYPGAFAAPESPATILASKLNPRGRQLWNKLGPDQYNLDPESRTVSMTIMPNEALLVARMHNYGGPEDVIDAKEFPLEQISLAGIKGKVDLSDRKVLTAFSEVSRALYTIEYK